MKKLDNFTIIIIILCIIGFIVNIVISAVQLNFSALIGWSLATIYYVMIQVNNFNNNQNI